MSGSQGKTLLGGIVVACIATLAWQGWAISRLEERIQTLEASPAPAPTAPTPAPELTPTPTSTPDAAATIDSQLLESAVETALRRNRPAPEAEARAIDEAVGRALRREKQEAWVAQGETFVREGADRLDAVLTRMVSEDRFPARRRQEVLDLMVGELHETWHLKSDVQEGRLGNKEGYAEWMKVRAEYTESLGGLVGEETARLLRERVDWRTKDSD